MLIASELDDVSEASPILASSLRFHRSVVSPEAGSGDWTGNSLCTGPRFALLDLPPPDLLGDLVAWSLGGGCVRPDANESSLAAGTVPEFGADGGIALEVPEPGTTSRW
jgi:hypothetical protein